MSNYSEYENKNGYNVFEDYNDGNEIILFWFKTYDEIFEEFGDEIVWDEENEMYIVYRKNEDIKDL